LATDGAFSGRQSQVLSRTVSCFWVEESAQRVLDRDGAPVYFGYVRDITPEKSSKWALAEAEEKYRSIFEHAVEGLFQLTPVGRFVTVQRFPGPMLGFPPRRR